MKSHPEHRKETSKLVDLTRDLDLIIGVHNQVRTRLYPDPSPEAHIQNENTLVRLHALVEANGWDATSEKKRINRAKESGCAPVDAGTFEGDVALMALTYLRNLVVHKKHGLYVRMPDSPWWFGFEEFLRRYPRANRFVEGEPIHLAGDAVLQPLLDGILAWAQVGRI